MAICEFCAEEMQTADSCDVTGIQAEGTTHARLRWGEELRFPGRRRPTERCHDCAVRPGGFHHPGCDMEECPICGDQMLMCGCGFDEEEAGESHAGPMDVLGRLAAVTGLGPRSAPGEGLEPSTS